MSGHIIVREFLSAQDAATYLNEPANEVTQIISVVPGTPRMETVKRGNTWIQQPLYSDMGKVLATFIISTQKHQKSLKEEQEARVLAKARELYTLAGREIVRVVHERYVNYTKETYIAPLISQFKELGPSDLLTSSVTVSKIQQMLYSLLTDKLVELVELDKLDLDVTLFIVDGKISLVGPGLNPTNSLNLNLFKLVEEVEQNKQYLLPENISKALAEGSLSLKFVQGYAGSFTKYRGRPVQNGIISSQELCGSEPLWILRKNPQYVENARRDSAEGYWQSGDLFSGIVHDVTIEGLPIFMIKSWRTF
jgi:hypothetical protein